MDGAVTIGADEVVVARLPAELVTVVVVEAGVEVPDMEFAAMLEISADKLAASCFQAKMPPAIIKIHTNKSALFIPFEIGNFQFP